MYSCKRLEFEFIDFFVQKINLLIFQQCIGTVNSWLTRLELTLLGHGKKKKDGTSCQAVFIVNSNKIVVWWWLKICASCYWNWTVWGLFMWGDNNKTEIRQNSFLLFDYEIIWVFSICSFLYYYDENWQIVFLS